MDEKELTQALDRACTELAENVGCPLSGATSGWDPENCPGPNACDQREDFVAQRIRCWKALCAGRNRIAEEVGSGG